MHYATLRFFILAVVTVLPAFAKDDQTVTIAGQAFLQTIDQGPMKLAAMKVYAIPLDAIEKFDDPDPTISLPKPLAMVVTDVEGRFSIDVPVAQRFFIYAVGGYTTRRGRFIPFEWHIPQDAISDKSNLQLQNTNSDSPQHKVELDGE